VTLSEIADLITSQHAEELARGNYYNRRSVRGYYVQLKCADHWCKISISNVDRHEARTRVRELDDLDPSTLTPTVAVPLDSIAAAIRLSSDTAVLSLYENTAMVPGVWADFRYGNNWYMISVSHVDVPARATPTQIDKITDEFLRQLGYGRGMRSTMSRNRAWR
jgi:hypothetical protein